MFNSVQTCEQYFALLHTIAMGMGPQRGFQAALKHVLGTLETCEDFLRPHVVIFDPETRMLRLSMTEGAAESASKPQTIVYEPGIGITGQVFVTGKAVVVSKLRDHPVFLSKFFKRTDEELDTLAFICVPILAPKAGADDVRSAIGVISFDTKATSPDSLLCQQQFLEVVAAMLASQVAHIQEDTNFHESASLRFAVGAVGLHSVDESLVAVAKSSRIALDQAFLAGRSRASVLLIGEKGTGKAAFASLIHATSSREALPLIRYCVSDYTDEMVERTLFGYRKGAFEGAVQTHKGSFELAQSSTLLLEDVGALSLEMQHRLLDLLESKEVCRVGGEQRIPIDVRLICTSVASLEERVAEGSFLATLYARINNFCITLAPLRDRVEDILSLSHYFLQLYRAENTKAPERISVSAQEALMQYPWPENIDALRLCLFQAFASCEASSLRIKHLPDFLYALEDVQISPAISFNDAVAGFEKKLITDALQQSHGNMFKAATLLQASYRVINYKIKKYTIDIRKFV